MANAMRFYISWMILVFVHIWIFYYIPRKSFVCKLKTTNSNSKIIFKDLPEDDPKQRQPDVSLAEKNINWNPTIDLKEGLRHTIEYFSDILNKV